MMGQTETMLHSPSAIFFREATLSDITAVIELVHSAYRGETSRAGWTTEADLLDGNRTDASIVQADIRAVGSVILLAYRMQPQERLVKKNHIETSANLATDELLACCHLKDEDGDHAYFGMFAVRPDCQGNGIGRVVLAEAERRAVTGWHCSMLRMLVIRQRVDLIAWYMRLGFARTGETKPFPYGDERFGLPKRPDLEFVELAKSLRPLPEQAANNL